MTRRRGPVGWWCGRTLNARLALLVTGAVTVAVLTMAVLAWTAVNEILHQQVRSELTTDANAIAAQPGQWSSGNVTLPDPRGGSGDKHGPHDLGPQWQILDANAAVVSKAATSLPITAAARAVAAGHHQRADERVTIGDDTYWMLTVPATGGGAVQVAVNQNADNHTLSTFALLLVAGCLIGIAGAALLGRLVARAGLAPVQSLAEAVETVAVTQDLTRPIAVDGVDAIARLGRSVNSLLAAVDSSRRAQRALVEDAGHELRTPLTSLRTNIELLLEVERQPELAYRLPPEDRVRLLGDLDAQIGELATLTTELVELSREEASREHTEPVDLMEVVQAATARARVRAPAVEFTTNLMTLTVNGRPGELERMVLNVLDNAGKWSPAGSTVQVDLTAQWRGWARLRITDSGPGIDAADRPYIFDRFYRATAARSLPGSGLGLAIVQQTATQHGGDVAVEANPTGGAIITIRLPVHS